MTFNENPRMSTAIIALAVVCFLILGAGIYAYIPSTIHNTMTVTSKATSTTTALIYLTSTTTSLLATTLQVPTTTTVTQTTTSTTTTTTSVGAVTTTITTTLLGGKTSTVTVTTTVSSSTSTGSMGVVQSKGGSGSSLSFDNTVSSGDYIFVSLQATGSIVPTDSLCTSWSIIGSPYLSGSTYLQLFYCIASASGTDRISIPTGEINEIVEVSGLHGIDGQAVVGTGTSVTSGSTAPLNYRPGDFLISAILESASTPISQSSWASGSVSSAFGPGVDPVMWQSSGQNFPTTFSWQTLHSTATPINYAEIGVAFLTQ